MSAFARAYHARYDRPKIFDDYFVEALLSTDELALLSDNLGQALEHFDPEAAATRPAADVALARVVRAMGSSIVLSRSRYTEELLDAAVARGATQYLILGAGLDTFAFRRPQRLAGLRVFEVDRPAAQADKLRRIAALGLPLPRGVALVPVDLESGELSAALALAGFDPRARTFCSWLGVTYYLSPDTFGDTLRALASLLRRGGALVFDHLDAAAFDPSRAAPRAQRMIAATRRSQEPMRSGFDPEPLARRLGELGFVVREHLDPAAIQARYFADAYGYTAFEHVHFEFVETTAT